MTKLTEPSTERLWMRPWVLLRPVLTTAALLVVYYALPLDSPDGGTMLALIVGLAALTVLVVWQVRMVMTSTSPRLRAIESLATVIPSYVVLFASSHFIMSSLDPATFTEPLDRTDALYFTVTILATVGFGDIAAVEQAPRIAVTVQMVTGLILLGVVVKLFLGAAQIGLRHTAAGRVAQVADADKSPTDGGPTRDFPTQD